MELPPNLVELVNARLGGFDCLVDLRFTHVAPDRVEATVEIGPQHLQAYGIVHGGLLSTLVETTCSVGAAIAGMSQGLSAVGLENSTSFLRGVRSGTLHTVATPVRAGRRTQLWEAVVTDQTGRTVATGKVRALCLEQGAALDGQKVQLKS
jgi:uncharacterized protein (TIGR00369 family)